MFTKKDIKKIKNIKVIFLDIDGTLKNSQKQITEYTQKVIKRAVDSGIHVVLCSGRANAYVSELSKECFASNYVISSNGAQIYDYEKNEDIYGVKIDYLTVKKVWDYLFDNGIECLVNTKDIRYGNKHLFISKDDYTKKAIDDISEIKDIDVYQIVTYGNEYENILEIEKLVSDIDDLKIPNISPKSLYKVNIDEPYFTNITSIDADKGKAIKYFLDFIGAKKEEAICFGDSMNDHEMFDECGYGVAMANAIDELKAKASFVTLSNNEDGVARFINDYLDNR